MQKDLISRQMAVDTIMGQPPEPHYPSWYAAQIEGLPPAQSETHWIPCSERLPEEGCHVVMCGADGAISIGRMGTNLFWVGTKVTTAVAWMPLPEPYKGGEKDDR